MVTGGKRIDREMDIQDQKELTAQESENPHMAPGRPRSNRAHQAILQAALELLDEQGYRALTIEAIAARAGVGKQTIYRWWPSKAEIILEAYTTYTDMLVPYPNTGSLRSDLLEYLEISFYYLREKGHILRGLMAEAQLDEEIGKAFQRVFLRPRREELIEVLKRGIQRGDLPPNTNPDVLSDVIYGAKWYRLMVQHAPLDQEFAQQLVDMVMSLA
jgi:AcrR family transcriptional regulator